MKRFGAAYYLLFVLMVFGCFSSMAQNMYGLKILGLVAIAFSMLFAVQFYSQLKDKDEGAMSNIIELICLTILSAILSMRVFYLRFPYVEMVFAIAGILLMLVQIQKATRAFTQHRQKNSVLAWLLIAFHGSIVLYTLSMTIVPFFPSLAEPAGAAAFALLIAFVSIGYVKRELMVGGEKTSALAYVGKLNDRSVVLAVLFGLFTAYMGFTRIGAVPKMYSDEFPSAYFDLVNKAETGKDTRVNGVYRHETFKKAYDAFVQRNSGKKDN